MKPIDINQSLHAVLEPLGFKKKRAVWNRSGKLIEVIDVQVSKARDSVTINAGVLDRDIFALLWQRTPPDFVDASFCTVRSRVGELINGLDHWWSLEDLSTASEMIKALEKYVLPFLQRMQSRQEMEDWLVKTDVVRKRYPLDIMALAVIKDRLGKKTEARQLISELGKRPASAWASRIAAVDEYLRVN